MNDIVMLIPCWRRPPIVRDCYQSISRLPVRRVWLISEEDEQKDQIYEIVKADTVIQFSNEQLGQKMNAGIRYIYEKIPGWRYLMNWGSDDLCHPGLLDLYKPYMDSNVLFFGVNNMYALDTFTGECTFFQDYNKDKPIGAGRMIHRTLIETMLNNGKTIYTDEARSGLDGDSQKRILETLKINATMVDAGETPYLVDVKTVTNINPFVFFKERPMCDKAIIDAVHGEVTGKYPRRPLVSVIIPYKADRGWLKDAIASVKAQTYKNIELIKSKSNKSVSYNFNAGVRRARGEYICYLCDDDLLPPTSIADRVNMMLTGDYDMIHGNAENFRDDKVTVYRPPYQHPTLEQMLDRNVIHGGTLMYHRRVFDKIGLFDETLTNSEEYEFNLRLISSDMIIGYYNKVVYCYRKHDGQKSLTQDQEYREEQIKQIKAKYGKEV